VARFVVHLHDATSLRFDLRLQIGDVLRSWAIPRGPRSIPPRDASLCRSGTFLSAGEFERVHERQIRGSGAVITWEEGPPRSCARSRATSRSRCTGRSSQVASAHKDRRTSVRVLTQIRFAAVVTDSLWSSRSSWSRRAK
jgi:hypothetical protein